MKLIIYIYIFLGSIAAFGQEDVIPRNEIAAEIGIFNRGLFGVSYTRNFGLKESKYASYWSATGALGVGAYWTDGGGGIISIPSATASLYGTISPSYNVGNDGKFFTLGGEFKAWGTFGNAPGYGAGGYFGFTRNFDAGFIFKFRLGATKWLDFDGSDEPDENASGIDLSRIPTPMLGFSFGWRL